MQIRYVDDGDGRYRPGGCNIGPEEIARRRQAVVIGAIATVVLAVALVAVGAPPMVRLAIFPFLTGTLVAVEQVRRRFCVAFGFAGVRNFGRVGVPEAVTDAAERSEDRRTAAMVVAYCSLIATVVTLVFMALPL